MQHTDFDQLWNYDQPAETEQRFRELIPVLQHDSTRYAELLTQIARTQSLQHQFDAAHNTLEQAQNLLSPDQPRGTIRYLLERGRTLNSSGHPEQAQPLFLEAWQKARDNHEDFYAIDAAHMMGIVAPKEQQLAWELKALRLTETTVDQRAKRWAGSLCNNIGWTYYDQQEFELALTYFYQAQKHWQTAQRDKNVLIARWCIAKTLRAMQRVEEAVAIQCDLLVEYEQRGENSYYVYEEVGECLLLQDRPDEAQPYFALAYEGLSQDQWLIANEAERIERLRVLGEPKEST